MILNVFTKASKYYGISSVIFILCYLFYISIDDYVLFEK